MYDINGWYPYYNLLIENLDWILGISALLGQVFIIAKLWWAPIFGFFMQGFWILFAIQREEYGLLPSVVGFTILYMWGMFKWTHERTK